MLYIDCLKDILTATLPIQPRLGVSVVDVMKGYVGFLPNRLAQLAEAGHYVIPTIIVGFFVFVLLLKLYNRLFNTLVELLFSKC